MRLAKLLLLLKKSFMLLHTLLIRLFFFRFLTIYGLNSLTL